MRHLASGMLGDIWPLGADAARFCWVSCVPGSKQGGHSVLCTFVSLWIDGSQATACLA